MRILCAIAICAAAAGPALPQSAGEAALRANDFDKAARIWREEAAAGDADAMMGLAAMADIGLGRDRDPAEALRWYLRAADAGSIEGAFNAGVMFDSGSGGPVDTGRAADLYALAAMDGYARAQFNLGLLYQDGNGVPRNPGVARAWLDLAARELPAAARRRDEIAPEEGFPGPVAPDPRIGAFDRNGDVDLVWAAPPASGPYRVEIVSLPETGVVGGGDIASRETPLSALSLSGLEDTGTLAWRVLAVTDTAYRTRGWRPLSEGLDLADMPAARVRMTADLDRPAAADLARRIGRQLSGAGVWVRLDASPDRVPQTEVLFGYEQDRPLAADIAAALPVLGRDDPILSPDAGLGPGEILVRLGTE